jgi:hypothetical protein
MGTAADWAERLTLQPLDLFRIGAAAALEL